MPNNHQPKLILASSSPRRAQLLKELGIDFEIMIPQINEIRKKGESPEKYVQRLAVEKVRAIRGEGGHYILAADTAVVLDGEILGKPENKGTALRYLKRLSGRTHEVLTGFAMAGDRGIIICKGCARSAVTFKAMTETEIRAYVKTREPFDKAGAYAAQGAGARFVEKTEGSRSNVIGLPVEELKPWFKKLGLIK